VPAVLSAPVLAELDAFAVFAPDQLPLALQVALVLLAIAQLSVEELPVYRLDGEAVNELIVGGGCTAVIDTMSKMVPPPFVQDNL
jgi:hypothetical protein